MRPAGEYRNKVNVERKTVTRDATGGEVVTWSLFKSRFASVKPLRGREYFAAAQMQSSVDYRIILRKPLAITRDMRVVYKSTPLDIVELIEHDDEFELMCSSGVRNAV